MFKVTLKQAIAIAFIFMMGITSLVALGSRNDSLKAKSPIAKQFKEKAVKTGLVNLG